MTPEQVRELRLSKATELQSIDEIETLFRRNLMTSPILRSVWQSGQHHKLSEEQILKWAISVFCELHNDEMQRKYDELMRRPFNPYFYTPKKEG